MNPHHLLLGTRSSQPDAGKPAGGILGVREGGAIRPLGGGKARKDAADDALDDRATADEEGSERAEQTQVDAEAEVNRRQKRGD